MARSPPRSARDSSAPCCLSRSTFSGYRACLFAGSRLLYTAVAADPGGGGLLVVPPVPALAGARGDVAAFPCQSPDGRGHPVPDRFLHGDAGLLDPRDLDRGLYPLLLRAVSSAGSSSRSTRSGCRPAPCSSFSLSPTSSTSRWPSSWEESPGRSWSAACSSAAWVLYSATCSQGDAGARVVGRLRGGGPFGALPPGR